MEIERKWLFNIDLPLNNNIDSELIAEYYYDQAYISVKPEFRIRRKSDANHENVSYMLCIKSKGDLERIEIEKELTELEFNQLIIAGGLLESDIIKKHCFNYRLPDGHILSVGYTDLDRNTFSYGEVEFRTKEEAKEFIAPDWFGQEVTYDSSYKMANYWYDTRIRIKDDDNSSFTAYATIIADTYIGTEEKDAELRSRFIDCVKNNFGRSMKSYGR